MPNYVAAEIADEPLASIVSHLKTKYELSYERCISDDQDFRMIVDREPPNSSAAVELYVVSHGADDICAMTAGPAGIGADPIRPGAFAHMLIDKKLPRDRPVRIKLAMCFGDTLKPASLGSDNLLSFARQVALVLGSYGFPAASGTYANVMVGGYDGEMHWSRSWKRRDPYKRDVADRHAPSAHPSNEINRTYYSVERPGATIYRQDFKAVRGNVYCFFPFRYKTVG